MKRRLTRRSRATLLTAVLFVVGLAYVSIANVSAGPAAPSVVSVAWGDSTGLVGWAPVLDAAAYRVTLIRVSDNGIMEQKTFPASQPPYADVQGLWPNEQYEVAVEAIDSTGNVGNATMSAPGQTVPLDRSTLNGFLDKENVAQGTVNDSLWDVNILDAASLHYGGAFVNGQLHYHLEAGDQAGTQTVAVMRARTPIDFANRTAHIHGEVDLKGDFHNWFGVALSPQTLGPDRVLDLNDRFFFTNRTMPILELFDDQDGLHLLYADGNNTLPKDLGHAPNPIGLSNVRDFIDWQVTNGNATVTIDGKVALSASIPGGLTFTHGYVTLLAEDYPNNTGGVHPPTACDAVLADCNVWHLDNWGFDASSGQQAQVQVYRPNGCAPYGSPEGNPTIHALECGTTAINGGGNTINLPGNGGVVGAYLDFMVKGPGSVSVSVNSGPYQNPAYYPSEFQYSANEFQVPISPSALFSGENHVNFRLSGSAKVFNPQIELVMNKPFVDPALPPEPAPLGTWTGSGGSSPTPTSTATNTPSPTGTPTGPIQINGVPCVITLNGVQMQGTCTGTFNPPTSPTATPTTDPTATPTLPPSPTATPTQPPTPTPTATPSPTPNPGGSPRQAGINAEPSMRPWRYSGANPDGWWCAVPNCFQNPDPMVTINSELGLAHQLGVSVVRVEFPWALIETGNGVYDWSRADAIVNAANAAGVQLQPVLVYTPAWINSDPTQSPTASEFSAFVTAIVSRYHTSIHYWEMWNEPDHFHYWNSGEAAYVQNIVIPGYAAAKAVDSNAQIILAGASVWNGTWTNTVYADGGGNSFDIVAIHDYSGSSGTIIGEANNAQNLLNSHGQGTKPVWIGEYSVSQNTIADSSQQALLTGVLTGSSPIAMAEWYNLRDDYAMTCCPPAIAVSGFWGLVQHDDTTLKNGFTTLQQLIAGGLPNPT